MNTSIQQQKVQASFKVFFIFLLCLSAMPAWADTLQIPESAPGWIHFAATAILVLHIAGGAIGIATGFIASGTKKGGKLHRISGRLLVRAMFVSYVIATAVAPFIANGQRPNFVAGILALYLLLSGVSAARRRNFQVSYAERFGLVTAFFVTAMGVWFAYTGIHSESGTVDGSPPQAFAIFVIFGFIAIVGEVRVLILGKLSNIERQKRHLWRMCASFFIASGSLFFGQPQIFPAWFNDSLLPSLFSFAPLIVMTYFLIQLSRVQVRTQRIRDH